MAALGQAAAAAEVLFRLLRTVSKFDVARKTHDVAVSEKLSLKMETEAGVGIGGLIWEGATVLASHIGRKIENRSLAAR